MRRRSEISPNPLAGNVLCCHYLRQEEPTWQQLFDALLTRVQSNSVEFSPDEIEADITAAAEEVQVLRHAHRGAS